MKILITGACGHIGSYLSENIYKIKKVSKAILIDNLKSNRFNSLFHSQKKNNLNFFVRDLNNINCLNDFNNIDTIIHCASMTNAEKSFGTQICVSAKLKCWTRIAFYVWRSVNNMQS